MTLSDLLKTPRQAEQPSLTIVGDTANAVVILPGKDLPGDKELIEAAGLNPEEYIIDHGKGIKHKSWDALRRVYDPEAGKHNTTKERMNGIHFTMVKKPASVDLSHLEQLIAQAQPVAARTGTTRSTLAVILGDTQAGKMENPLEGLLARFNEALELAVAEAAQHKVESIVIAWMGDCIEGFVSQGGRNAWRTVLTLTEQLRVVRRLMLRAIDRFIDEGYQDITVISVPGNHGDTVREPVTTRYDDSYDVDSLVAVWEALQVNPERYGGRVTVVVPDEDEIGVTLAIEGVHVSFIHGHQFRPGQHWKWWEGQALGRTQYGESNVLFTGHGHHTVIEERAERTFVMAPALEERSTWWVHKTGQTGNPGVILARFSDGEMVDVHKVTTRSGMGGAGVN